jgi:putative ABC transport system permease protein
MARQGRQFVVRIVEQFRRRRVERDLDDELRAHLEFLIDDGRRRGLSPDVARTEALRAMGGFEQTREAVRDRRGFRGLETLVQNVSYAWRSLAGAPGFTIAAVITLALGIGANTAIFSLVDAAILRPLPYAEPGSLVSIWEVMPNGTRSVVAPANYVDYRRARNAAAIGAYMPAAGTLTGAGEPVRLAGEEVTGSYFDTLAIAPAQGRPLHALDNEPGRPNVVVVSYALWQDRFGLAPDLVGRTITINQESHEVVGIMPRDFAGVSQFRTSTRADFWIPSRFPADLLANRDDHEVHVVARLAPARSVAALADELRGIAAGFGPTAAGGAIGLGATSLHADVVRDVSSLLLFLLGAVALILLLACLNVAGLLVVRSLARRREIAVRLALGATRQRVAGELLIQSLVLALLGAAAGWGLAVVLKDALVALTPVTIPRLDRVALDGRVLLFTAGVATITGVFFSLLPAWQLSRTRPMDALAATARVVSHSWALRSRTILVIVEVAVSMLLLVGAGLMIRTIAHINGVDLGFGTANVLTATVTLPPAKYPEPAQRLGFFEAVTERVEAIPGVRAMAFANRLPLRGSWSSGLFIDPLDGPLSSATPMTSGFQAVSPGYFDVLGVRLVRGRLIDETDREGTLPVAVVNEAFAPALLAGSDPIGRRVRRGPKMPAITIVGVVANIRRHGPRLPIDPEVYVAARQTSVYPLWLSEIAVRVDRDAAAFAPELRRAVWTVDRDQPIAARLLEDTLANGQAAPRFQAFLLTLFATLALALAAVGIYGVVAYAVSQRAAEIGLRLALGAEASRLLRWIVARSLRPVLAGAAIGLAAAILLARMLDGFLFEVSPVDPLTYAAATALLVVMAIAASYVAARRAVRIDPLAALK